jgi:hypothetical protein
MNEEKTFKLPQDTRKYFRDKARQKRGWTCITCGGEPAVKDLETKKKYCKGCYIKKLKEDCTKEQAQTCTA